MERVFARDRHDVDQPRTQPFTGPARCEIIGVAGDPKPLHAVTVRQRKDQPAGALGEMMAARGRIYMIPYVPAEHFDFRIGPHAKTDPAGDLE